MALNKIQMSAPVKCSECGFSSTDLALVAYHSCDVEENGGRCEDFPCCGHERGDCNGKLYGSDESIMNYPRWICDHNDGYCDEWEDE